MDKKKNGYVYLLVAAAFLGIVVTGAVYGCPVYRVIPLCVSLVVMLLQTRANRMTFLLGGLNAAYYAVVYFSLGLYGMSLYSLLVACPLQIVTWLRWRKNAYAQATVLRRLTGKQRLRWSAGLAGAWLGLYLVLDAFGSGYLILDNTISIISTAGNLGSVLSLIEFPFAQILAHVLSITLYVQMVQQEPAQWPFLIFFTYALICSSISAWYMHKLYRKQRKEGEAPSATAG